MEPFIENMLNFFKGIAKMIRDILPTYVVNKVVPKSQDELLTALIARIYLSLPDLTPNSIQNHIPYLIMDAIAFGWKHASDYKDFESLLLKLTEKMEKEKPPDYVI